MILQPPPLVLPLALADLCPGVGLAGELGGVTLGHCGAPVLDHGDGRGGQGEAGHHRH